MLVVQATLAVRSLVQENPTVDEVVHLPAGVTYWQTGSFRMYPHNPPLVKLVAALPVLGLAHVDYASKEWKVEPPNKAAVAHEFQERNARDYFEIFARARLLMPLFAVVGGLVVFCWSRALYGPAGGLVSLALWTVCPNVLAHTRLVTTDMAATSIGALATFLFWRELKQPSWKRAASAGVALGLAQLTKFSLLMLFALWPLLTLASLASGGDAKKRFTRLAGHAVLVVGLCVVVIDAGYAFEGVGIPLGQYEFLCQTLTKPVPPGMPRPAHPDRLRNGAMKFRVNRFRGTVLAGLPVPLPKYYVLGFDEQKLEAEGIPAKFLEPGLNGAAGEQLRGYPVYLDGGFSQTSWWYYYLFTLAYKVPEGTWLLAAASALVSVRSRRSRAAWVDEVAVLTVPVFVLFVMSVFTNIALGLRYVLPIFPYLYVSAGKLGPWAGGFERQSRRRRAWALVGVGLAASALATASIQPHPLAYFNWVSGGPDRGADHLIDSNIDWGQDLVGLRKWLARNAPGEPVGLAYFGQVNPRVFEARGEAFEWFLPPPRPGSMEVQPTRYRGDPASIRLKPGLYAVSASLAKGLPWRVYDAPVFPQEADRWAPWPAGFGAFSYFDRLRPVARVGHSIWIYRVSPEDAERLAPVWSQAAAAGPP